MAITGCLQEKYGTYYAVLNLKDKNGKRKQKWIPTGYPVKGNKKRANEVLQAKIAEYSKLEYYTDITVAEYFKIWLEKIKNDVRPTTYRGYLGNMTVHIIPYFEAKKIKLIDLKSKDLTEYYDYKVKTTDLSARTLKHHHQNISKALNDAIADYGCFSFNPAKYAKTPKEKQYNPEFLTRSQTDKLIELLEGNTIKLPVELCAIYGFRRSEVLGLKWKHISFENGTIRVCETLQQSTKAITGTTSYTSETKTQNSNRTMPMTERAREILQAQKEKQERNKALFGNSYIESEYVCTFDNGTPISPNYLSRNFHKVIVSSGLPQIRLHDLRHSSVSNLLSEGFAAPLVAAWHGHDVATMMKYYAHSDLSEKRAIADSLDARGSEHNNVRCRPLFVR